jgi:hypothetical protein
MEHREALALTQSIVAGDSRLQNLGDDAISKLADALRRAENGNPVDYRTPFWNQRPRGEIASELKDFIGESPIAEHNFNDSQELPKLGTTSVMRPWSGRVDDARAYFELKENNWVESAMFQAAEEIKALIPAHSVRPMSLENAVDMLPKSTQWGLPYMETGRDSWDKHLRLASQLSNQSDIFPSVLYGRVQAGGEESKNRTVWGQPHYIGILEATLMYPLLTVLRLLQGFSAWSDLTDVDRAITRMLNTPGVKNSTDYSHFDTSPSYELGCIVWDILKHWLVEAVADRVDLLREMFLTSDLLVPLKCGPVGMAPFGNQISGY